MTGRRRPGFVRSLFQGDYRRVAKASGNTAQSCHSAQECLMTLGDRPRVEIAPADLHEALWALRGLGAACLRLPEGVASQVVPAEQLIEVGAMPTRHFRRRGDVSA